VEDGMTAGIGDVEPGGHDSDGSATGVESPGVSGTVHADG
jgi:hypothetical protein